MERGKSTGRGRKAAAAERCHSKRRSVASRLNPGAPLEPVRSGYNSPRKPQNFTRSPPLRRCPSARGDPRAEAVVILAPGFDDCRRDPAHRGRPGSSSTRPYCRDVPAIADPAALVQILPEVPQRKAVVSSLTEAVAGQRDAELLRFYEGSQKVFDEIAGRHLDRWVVTFSGGKDSTLTALLAADYLNSLRQPPRLDVVYSDTLMEIPAMRRAAGSFLNHLRRYAKKHALPIRARIVEPAVENRFWVRMIGKGYPPPKPKFRWCTRRLKIEPAAPYVNTGKPTAVLTGVRYGESPGRTGRLKATCAHGGECGQDYWAQKGPRGSNITYFAPVIDWRTCKVWDFLHFVAPLAGWPTQDVYALYGDTSLRFGCWTCTLVRRDKTVETLIAREPGSPLERLHEFREFVWGESRKPENRLVKNGHLAGLKPEFRQELLSALLSLQSELGSNLISPEELGAIHALWAAAR